PWWGCAVTTSRTARLLRARILLDRRPAAAVGARMAGADFSAAILLYGPDYTPYFCYGGALSCEPPTLRPFPPGATCWSAAAAAPRAASTPSWPARAWQRRAGKGAGPSWPRRPFMVGRSGRPLRLVADGPTIEAADGWSVRPSPIDWRQLDQPTMEAVH